MPRVTVAITSYNHADYLGPALDSALAQTYRDFRIIVADDGSSDHSVELAERYAARHPRIEVRTHPGRANRGIAATSNLCARAPDAEYITWLDSDDLWFPDTLARRVAFMETHPEIALMCGHYAIIDRAGAVKNPRAGPDLTPECRNPLALVHALVMGCVIGAPTVMVRRDVFEGLGRFDDLVYCDWELWTRIAAQCPVGFLNEVTVMYRRHDHNYSSHLKVVTDLENRLAVIMALRAKAAGFGGLLTHPRIQAALHLQACCLHFCLGRRAAAAEHFARALAADATLFHDGGKYFAQWLAVNPPVAAPRKDFQAWIADALRAYSAPLRGRADKVSVA